MVLVNGSDNVAAKSTMVAGMVRQRLIAQQLLFQDIEVIVVLGKLVKTVGRLSLDGTRSGVFPALLIGTVYFKDIRFVLYIL